LKRGRRWQKAALRSFGVRLFLGLLDGFQSGEAMRLSFLHADLFPGDLRGEVANDWFIESRLIAS
jgi:hypothetical protein